MHLLEIHPRILSNPPLPTILTLPLQLHLQLYAQPTRIVMARISMHLARPLIRRRLFLFLFFFFIRHGAIRRATSKHGRPKRRLGRGGVHRGGVVDRLEAGVVADGFLDNGRDVERCGLGLAV